MPPAAMDDAAQLAAARRDRYRKYLARSLAVLVVAFLVAMRSWYAFFAVFVAFTVFQLTVIQHSTSMVFLGGFPTFAADAPVLLTHKRGWTLYLNPLPPDIDVLWDTWAITKTTRYKVRFIRSGGTWLAQRTADGSTMHPTKDFVSTREHVDGPGWQTWYVAKGDDWQGTVLPPREVQDGAEWLPVGPAKNFKGPKLMVYHPEDRANIAALITNTKPTLRNERRRR